MAGSLHQESGVGGCSIKTCPVQGYVRMQVGRPAAPTHGPPAALHATCCSSRAPSLHRLAQVSPAGIHRNCSQSCTAQSTPSHAPQVAHVIQRLQDLLRHVHGAALAAVCTGRHTGTSARGWGHAAGQFLRCAVQGAMSCRHVMTTACSPHAPAACAHAQQSARSHSNTTTRRTLFEGGHGDLGAERLLVRVVDAGEVLDQAGARLQGWGEGAAPSLQPQAGGELAGSQCCSRNTVKLAQHANGHQPAGPCPSSPVHGASAASPPYLLVQALGVALLAHLDGHSHVDLQELACISQWLKVVSTAACLQATEATACVLRQQGRTWQHTCAA